MDMLELKTDEKEFYIVKDGDDLRDICKAANVSFTALCVKNNLQPKAPLVAGMVLLLPPSGNLYTVCEGDDILTLCGSRERFIELNGSDTFYVGQEIRI